MMEAKRALTPIGTPLHTGQGNKAPQEQQTRQECMAQPKSQWRVRTQYSAGAGET